MKKLNLNIKQILPKLRSLLQRVRRYTVLIFVLVVAAMYGFLVFRINSLDSQEPSDEQVTDGLQTVHRPKIDQSALDKIQQLQDKSTDVRTLFKRARDNPFSE